MAGNKKLETDLQKAIRDSAQQFIKDIPPKDYQELGDTIVDEMKNLISKGISPIEGKGRFPAYKWAAARNDIKQVVGRFTKGQKSKEARDLKREAKSSYSNKYPFNVDPFLNKKPRPVNLFLYGDFLESLTAKVRGGKLLVGVFGKESVLKEQGHREGANSQPSRPIIPIDAERFSTTIVRKVELKLREIFRRKK